MLRTAKTLPTVAAFAAIAACTNPTSPATEKAQSENSFVFRCGDTVVQADYSASGEELTLTVDGQAYVLPSVVAASGAKYERIDDQGTVMFWNKADWAIIEINGTKYPDCSAL